MLWEYSWCRTLRDHLDLCNLRIIEGLRISGYDGTTCDGENPVIQYDNTFRLLDADHGWACRIPYWYLLWCSPRWNSFCGHNHAAIVVECQLILKPVPTCALIEGHVALDQFDVQWCVEPAAIGVCDSLVLSRCSVLFFGNYAQVSGVEHAWRFDTLVVYVQSLLVCLAEIALVVIVIKAPHFLLS